MLVGTSAIDSSRLRALTMMVCISPEDSVAEACSCARAGAVAPRSVTTSSRGR